MSPTPDEGRTFHVDPDGDPDAAGGADAPLGSVSAAAARADPGDTVVVHDGVYRERVDPPRGGRPDAPITYRAAAEASPVLSGAEIVAGWERAGNGCWTATLPGEMVPDPNPFADPIAGHWFDDRGRDHHRGYVACDGRPLPEAASRDALRASERPGWHATVDGDTTILARFGADPADATVEAAVRPVVFYPAETGIDHIHLRGLTFRHAATQWAPPTHAQPAVVGTHWSRGWIVADCEIAGSRCSGLSLGMFGDWREDSPYEQSAEGYNETIRDARDRGWERGTIGGHSVRNCEVHRCGQAGIVGSLGCAYSAVVGCHVHDVYRRLPADSPALEAVEDVDWDPERPFAGAEMAGVKFHGAVDARIAGNWIHDARRGLWLDWMAQGTRVTRNVFADNDRDDLFLEVTHGPAVVDTNALLSDVAVLNWSHGTAFVHNLLAGDVGCGTTDRRTPHLEPHGTAIAGLDDIQGGDDRWYNNCFVGGTGLAPYTETALPSHMSGNAFLDGAAPATAEDDPAVDATADPDPALTVDGDAVRLTITPGPWADRTTRPVTTDRLGETAVGGLPFTAPDGSPLQFDRDLTGNSRDGTSPTVGPVDGLADGDDRVTVRVWPPGDEIVEPESDPDPAGGAT